VALSAADTADGMVRVAEETAVASGEALTASESQEVWTKSMLEQARTAEGPLRDAIFGYIEAANEIPPEKLTEIQALIDQGKLAEAQRALDALAKPRSTTLTVRVQATGDTGVFSANRGSRIINEARALGGPVEAGTPYTVNELGPRGSEMFVSAKDGRVVSRAAASQAISEGVAAANSGGGGLSARDLAALAEAVKAGAREGAYLGSLAGNKDLSSSIRAGSRF
jgi:hypothetical protein